MAITVIDSSASGPKAMLVGSASSFGDYDQCLDIQSQEFAGKYCLVNFKAEQSIGRNSPIHERMANAYPIANTYYPLSGLCVPSTCSKSDVSEMLKLIFPKYRLQLLNISHNCDTKESNQFDYNNLNYQQKFAM